MEGRDREPGRQLSGAWDRLVGPGATENAGSVGAAALGAAVGLAGAQGRRPLRRGMAVLMAADLFSGVRANATPAATRWYHDRGQGPREMQAFSAAHLHPFLVAALYRESDWRLAWGNYAYLLAATYAVAGTPAPLRCAVGLLLSLGGA